MPYGLNPYGGYTGLRIPQDNNMLGAGPVGAGPAPGMGVDPGVANLQPPEGALTPQMGGGGGGGLGPLAGFAMNMFMGALNKGHGQQQMYPQHIFSIRPPAQANTIAPPTLYHPLAIGRPYG